MHIDSYFDPEGPGGEVAIARDGEDAYLDVIGLGVTNYRADTRPCL